MLAETLARLGVRQAVTSPGSRFAAADVRFRAASADRGDPGARRTFGGIFRAGAGQAAAPTGRARLHERHGGSEYLPAIVEAHESGVPLLVLTADRPPELRDCASGRPSTSRNSMAASCSSITNSPCPRRSSNCCATCGRRVAHGWHAATRGRAGASELPFRDPLGPVEEARPDVAKIIGEDFFSHLSPASGSAFASARNGKPFRYGRRRSLGGPRPPLQEGIIVAGPEAVADRSISAAVQRLARALGWPVLADVLSPVRNFPLAGVVRSRPTTRCCVRRNGRRALNPRW